MRYSNPIIATLLIVGCESTPTTRGGGGNPSSPNYGTITAAASDGGEAPESGAQPPSSPPEADPVPPLAPDEKAAVYRDLLREYGVERFFDLPDDVADQAAKLLQPADYVALPEGLNEATAVAYEKFTAAASEKPELSDAEVAALKESFVGEGAIQVDAVQP